MRACSRPFVAATSMPRRRLRTRSPCCSQGWIRVPASSAGSATSLACDPELCTRLASEWEESDDGRQPLPLAGRVFQETLRLYPASWFVARRALVAETLAGTDVPPETTVVMSPFVVHRDPRWYADPASLEPDRWLGATDLPRFAFFAFGGGVRQCIGERLARLEGEVLAGALAAHVTFLPPSRPPVVHAGASLRFQGPLVLEARRR